MADSVGVRQGEDWKRRQIVRMGLVSAALFIAGCQVVPKAPPKPVEAPPEEGPTSGLPTDATRHRIALLVPLSGANAAIGESISNAANMAVLDTGGQRIRMTVYDTAGGSAAAAEKAIAEGNKLILGPLLAEDVRAAAEVSRKNRVPLIAFSNDVSVAGNGTYLLGFTPAQSVSRVVGYARSRGLVKFAGLVPAGVYGQRAQTALTRSVEEAGGTLVSVQTYDRNAGAIMGAITRLNKAGAADAVLIADSSRTAVQAVPILRRGPSVNAKVLGTELWNTEASLASSALAGAWFASVSDGVYNQMATKYRARFGTAPFRLSSLGYDAVLLATKVATNWKVGTPFPLRALDDAGGFAGIDGAFRFNAYGVAERALEVQQVGTSGATVVSPAPKSFAD
jgi:ABC-type branched-subunit amino acid transport system substrate-binding protein